MLQKTKDDNACPLGKLYVFSDSINGRFGLARWKISLAPCDKAVLVTAMMAMLRPIIALRLIRK
jgi:hypothetical protein